MNSIDAFQRRLRDDTIAVEKAIESHNQQLEALNRRLEGLRRAAELLESEQAAVVELLQTGTADGRRISWQMPSSSTPREQKATRNPQPTAARVGIAHKTQSGNSKAITRPNLRTESRDGGLTRLDMIAAVLRRHPRRSVRELIALLNKEYRWKTTESAVTGHLYTRRDRFVHTPPDRTTNRPVTWSAK